MKKAELLVLLSDQLSAPQPSERWAMYRLIAPIVDYANNSLRLTPYFEFNQTSRHGTHQSVDIALLDQYSHPQVLIEAKRLDRPITPEQIDKYIEGDVRGIVSNGVIWVLCRANVHTCLHIYAEGVLQKDALNSVIAFIQGRAPNNLHFRDSPEVYRTDIKPLTVRKHAKATRKVHAKAEIGSPSEFRRFIDCLESPLAERSLLDSINKVLQANGIPPHIRIEVRDTRVSLFDERRARREQRIARIELGKQHPDVLVRTEITQVFGILTDVVNPDIHDKGAHMRRFRIADEDQASRFGQALMTAISH